MSCIFIDDIRGPLTSGTSIVLGAAGQRGRRDRCPVDAGLCQTSIGLLPAGGSCPCGSIPRPL